MPRRSRLSWMVRAFGVVLLAQLGTACGLVDSGSMTADGSDGSGGSGGSDGMPLGTGGQPWFPWGPDDVIVEGCESPTYAATSFCYSDCPKYDASRAACDPLCTSSPPPECPPRIEPPTGGAAPVLDPCNPVAEPGSMGGAGGETTCVAE